MNVRRNKLILFLSFVVIVWFFIANQTQYQEIYTRHKNYFLYENTSILSIETKTNFVGNIAPNDNTVFLNLTLKNFGPSESSAFLLHVFLCKPPECKAEETFAPYGNTIETDAISIDKLAMGEQETTRQTGFRVDKEGLWKVIYYLESIQPLPKQCGGHLQPRCYIWVIDKDEQMSYSIQVISQDAYATYLLNKRIELLTVVIVILGILTLFKNEIKQFLKKFLKI